VTLTRINKKLNYL